MGSNVETLIKVLKYGYGIIDIGDTIPLETFEYLNTLSIPTRSALFTLVENSTQGKEGYSLERKCLRCGQSERITKISRTAISKCFCLKYDVKNTERYANFLCPSCRKAYLEEEQKRKEEQKINSIMNYCQDLLDRGLPIPKQYRSYFPDLGKEDVFASQYLSYDVPYRPENCVRDFIDMQAEYSKCDQQSIIRKILNIPYRAFLLTPYWRITAAYAKEYFGNKCQLCGSRTNLEVHHRNYDHRGEEIVYWKEDLICLCHECHSKFHDKL